MTDIAQPHRILVTEDEPAMMEAITTVLGRAGFSVIPAKDGKEGVEFALRDHPDCIILDILMPNVDGVTMMETLRRDTWGKTIPIIILTNLDASDKMIETILRNQPSYYLIKASTSLEDLVEKVKNVLSV